MDSSSGSLPRGYPCSQHQPTHRIIRSVNDVSYYVAMCPPEYGGSLDKHQQNKIIGSAVSTSEPGVLHISPTHSTTTKQGTPEKLILEQEAKGYLVSCFLDSQTNTSPLEFKMEILRLISALEASTREPLPRVKDQLQESEVKLFSEAIEGLFRICLRKTQASRYGMIGYSKFTQKAPQKLRNALKRQVRLSLDGSVGRDKDLSTLPIIRGLRRSRLTYQQALRALPLVVKCVPEPLRRKLIARTKAKALKMATNLLKRWCF